MSAPIRSIAYYDVGLSRVDAFVRRYQELGLFDADRLPPGLAGAELCRALDGSPLVAVLALADSTAAAGDGRSSQAELLAANLSDLLPDPPVGDLMQQVVRVGRSV